MEESNIRKITYNSTSILGAIYLTYIISFIISVMLIRYLGTLRFGQYCFVMAFVSIFGFFGDFGLARFLIREVSRKREESRKYLGNFLILQTALSLLILCLIFITINLLRYSPEIKTYVYISGLGISIYLISRAFECIITAYEYIYYNALLSICYKIINSFLILIVILLRKGILELAIMFLIANIFITFISASICMKKCGFPKFKVDFRELKLYMKGSVDFGLINFFGILPERMGIVFLSKIRGDREVGLFSSVYKFSQVIFLIINSLDTMLYPLFSRQYAINKEKISIYFRKTARYLSYIGFPVAVFFFLFARQVISTFFGNSYIEAVGALRISIWLVPFSFLSALCSIALTSINKSRPVTFILGFNCIQYLVLNIIFQQRYGYVGLCWISLFAVVFTLTAFYYFIHRELLKVNLLISEILPSLSLSAILFLIFSHVRIDNIWFIISLYASAYLIFLLIHLIADSYDLSLLKSIIKHFLIKKKDE